ncbi:MAG: arsenate reductase [Bacteroidetes bacterium]|nr:arsenate reductase [Bacteroidota bacterium]
MKKMYHLGNCTTCQAIIKKTGADTAALDMQDIKFDKITPAQLEESDSYRMKKMAGSYEALFSCRALKDKELGLKDKKLEEKDYRKLILEENTFLKRLVTIPGNKIFIGNDKKTAAALKDVLKK